MLDSLVRVSRRVVQGQTWKKVQVTAFPKETMQQSRMPSLQSYSAIRTNFHLKRTILQSPTEDCLQYASHSAAIVSLLTISRAI